MDLTQAILYSNLTHLPFYYYVFDYPKYNPGYKLIPVKTVITHPYDHEAITRNIQLDQIIRWTVSTILEWHELGYPKNPNINMKYESGKTNPESCIKCPITDCNEKSKITAI
jgi:hypothetical protein